MAIPVLLPRMALGQEIVDAFEGAIRDEGLEPRRKSHGFALVPGSVREVPERSSLTFSIFWRMMYFSMVKSSCLEKRRLRLL